MADQPFFQHITTEQIETAAAVIQHGGLVVIPTRGLYGIAADVFNPAAVARVFTLKGRSAKRPLLALINHMDMLSLLVKNVPSQAERLINRFWPGRVTLVLDAVPGLPEGMCSADGKIGVRWVAHPVAAALVCAAGCPITGTSANLSGENGAADIRDIPSPILDGVEMVLDAGPLAGGPGSTVVDATGERPLILRHGVVSAEEITAG
jgi:L-threonylcarbamoyladenylate synthase